MTKIKNKRLKIMVDMSATLIHHGHIRLLKKAAELGDVIVGLTTDAEIMACKGYTPELGYQHRKEILESIRYVTKVVPVTGVISDAILKKHDIDYLVHGNDSSNLVDSQRIKTIPRTKGISSSDIRVKSQQVICQINNAKLMLTPGPAVILHENLRHLKPVFGRGDVEYTLFVEKVIEWIKQLSEQDEIVMAQGSATFALELAAHSFVRGKILLISTGYYSNRLEKLLADGCQVTVCHYDDLDNISQNFDWLMCAYTETSTAFKVDLTMIRKKANKWGAKLYVDATGSIGLEENHGLAGMSWHVVHARVY